MISRRLCLGAAALALTVPLAGCVTVHGERESIPSVRTAEATQVLAHFVSGINTAAKAYDAPLIPGIGAGPFGAIEEAGLRARHVTSPAGDPSYSPLVFTDQKFLIPRQVGWPKFFVADTAVNRGTGVRWQLVFRRAAPGRPWLADFLSAPAGGRLPEIATDSHGNAVAVPATDASLLVPPGKVADAYAGYLKDGSGSVFADGPFTSKLRSGRAAGATTANSVTQYADQPASGPESAPVALRTKDGGALVFFGTEHRSRATFRAGYRLAIDDNTKALMTGAPKTSVTLNNVAQQLVLVPRSGSSAKVAFLSRVVGLVSAEGA